MKEKIGKGESYLDHVDRHVAEFLNEGRKVECAQRFFEEQIEVMGLEQKVEVEEVATPAQLLEKIDVALMLLTIFPQANIEATAAYIGILNEWLEGRLRKELSLAAAQQGAGRSLEALRILKQLLSHEVFAERIKEGKPEWSVALPSAAAQERVVTGAVKERLLQSCAHFIAAQLSGREGRFASIASWVSSFLCDSFMKHLIDGVEEILLHQTNQPRDLTLVNSINDALRRYQVGACGEGGVDRGIHASFGRALLDRYWRVELFQGSVEGWYASFSSRLDKEAGRFDQRLLAYVGMLGALCSAPCDEAAMKRYFNAGAQALADALSQDLLKCASVEELVKAAHEKKFSLDAMRFALETEKSEKGALLKELEKRGQVAGSRPLCSE